MSSVHCSELVKSFYEQYGLLQSRKHLDINQSIKETNVNPVIICKQGRLTIIQQNIIDIFTTRDLCDSPYRTVDRIYMASEETRKHIIDLMTPSDMPKIEHVQSFWQSCNISVQEMTSVLHEFASLYMTVGLDKLTPQWDMNELLFSKFPKIEKD